MNSAVDTKPASKSMNTIWFFTDSWLMTKRSVLHLVRSLDQVMGLIAFPIMFTLLNRYVLGGAIEQSLPEGVNYANFVFAGVFIQTLAFGANYTTINLAVDLKEGIVDRFRSLPMNNSALIIGHIISDLFRNLISGVIIVIVAFAIGFRPDATFLEWASIIFIVTMFTLAVSALSAILGLMVKSLEAAQWIGFVVIFPLTFISSAFVPVETMPSWLQGFANNQPLTLVMDYVRALTTGDYDQGDTFLHALFWSIGIILASIPITTWMFKKRSNV